MITSFEVGAIFDIENRASDTLAAIAEQMQELAATARETADAIRSIGEVNFASLNRSLTGLRNRFGQAQSAASEFAATMNSAATGAAASAAQAAEGIDSIGAAAARARNEAQALRQELARPFVMGGGGGGGGGGISPYIYEGDVMPPGAGEPRRGIGFDAGTIDGEAYEIQRLGYQAGLLTAPDGGGGGLGGSGPPTLIPGQPYYSGGSGGATFRRSGYVPNWAPGGTGTPGGGSVPPGPPRGPIPLPLANNPTPQGGFHGIGLGEMIEGDLIYHAVHEAMDESLSLRRTELSLGLPTSGPEEAADAEQLRAIARTAAQGTIFSERQTAAAMPVLAREFGFKGAEGLTNFGNIFPTALRSAEVANMEKLGGLDDTLSANVEYAHMTGRYNPKELEAGLNTLQAVATATNQSPHSEEAILKYSVPIGIAAGIGADPTAIATGFLQQQGFNSSTAGTGLAQIILGALDTGGPMNAQHRARVQHAEESLGHALGLTPDQIRSERHARHAHTTEHQQALQQLGITDAAGHLRAVDGHGNLDLGVLEHDIYDYSRHHTHQETLAALHGAFGTRGERVAAVYTEDNALQRQQNFQTAINATPGAVAQQQALADTPMQHFEQLVARTGDLFNTLATATLPTLDGAFQHLTAVVGGTNEYLQGHPEAAQGGALTIGSFLAAQTARLGAWALRRAGMSGLAARVGGLAELGPVGEIAGLAMIGESALGSLFPNTTQAAHKAEEEEHNSLFGRIGRFLFPTVGAFDLLNHASGAGAPAASAAAAAITANSNNTTTLNVGGVSVTVNAASGQEGPAAGQSVVGAIVNAIRTHLMTSSGPGEGVTHAGATAGAVP